MVMGELKKRSDSKLNKGQILFRGMADYAKYGSENPFNDVISADDLKAIDPNELTDLLHQLTSYEHRILYYGPQDINAVSKVLEANHKMPETLMALPAEKEYPELATDENVVYFCEYDMVQTELMMYHRGETFDESILPASRIFNEYFGD